MNNSAAAKQHRNGTPKKQVAPPPIKPTPPPAMKRKEKRAPFLPTGKHVVHEVEVLLKTEAATRVFESTMEPVRAASFLLEDALPRRARDECKPMDELLDVIESRFSAVEKSMSDEVARLELLAKNLGCNLPKRYTHADSVTVVYGYSPTFFRFVDLVIQLDTAMQWLDSLWLARSLHSKDRGETIVRCRNLLLHLSRELQSIKVRANTAVVRLEIDRSRTMAARAVKEAAAELRRQERNRKKIGVSKVTESDETVADVIANAKVRPIASDAPVSAMEPAKTEEAAIAG